ncbi:MAG: hypothetical protein ACLRWQ_18145 [Flavonifractor plautii]
MYLTEAPMLRQHNPLRDPCRSARKTASLAAPRPSDRRPDPPERPHGVPRLPSRGHPGTLFVCKGAANSMRPPTFRAAAAQGAFAYVSERVRYPATTLPCPAGSPTSGRPARHGLTDRCCLRPPQASCGIAGITGTKGKTTTAYYLKSILDAEARPADSGRETALLSTIVTDDGRGAQARQADHAGAAGSPAPPLRNAVSAGRTI